MKKEIENLRLKKIHLFRLFSLTIMMAFVTPVISDAQAGKTNFSGTWTLNAEKSTPAQGRGQMMGGGNVIVKQEGNLLTVERTRNNQNGEATTITMKYTLDGKESVNTTPRGTSKAVATWSADGRTLTINSTRTIERDGSTMEMKSTEVWTLSGDKVLTVQTTATTPNGERKSTLVYDKK
jgi:hypothetical protein